MAPFVFLPGTLCDERIFREQTSFFKPNKVLDLRHSESLSNMIELVNQVEDEKFVLVGFSMGGYVAQEFALQYPERVEKLIIIASSSEGYPEKERQIVTSSLEIIKKGPFKGITDKRLREYLHPKSYENAEIKNLIQEMAGPDAKEVYLRQLKATLERRNLTNEIKELKMPAMFVAGADDHIVSAISIERPLSAKTHFEMIEECGHFVPLEKASELNRLIYNFIST
jgi:pimeloyl-ACP methyl ester carboxylesterase